MDDASEHTHLQVELLSVQEREALEVFLTYLGEGKCYGDKKYTILRGILRGT